jgi:hypothetical protein
MALSLEKNLTYDQVAETVVEMGNRILDGDESADDWEVASGILAGAVQFWLYSRQPCADPLCHACEDINSAERRMYALLREMRTVAEESEHYSSAHDVLTGTA